MTLVSHLVYRHTNQFILAPVIVRTAPNRLREFALSVGGRLTSALPDLVPGSRLFESVGQSTFGSIRQIPRFNMLSLPATVDMVDELKQDPAVQGIYLDRTQRTVAVPPEGVFKRKTGKPFTTTLWTKKLIGSEQAEQEGFTGKGVKLAVLDTTGLPNHQMIARAKSYSAIGPLRTDRNGHGCLSGSTLTMTSICGLRTLEELWNEVDLEPVSVKDGEAKILPTVHYTSSKDGPTMIKALFRTKADKKVVIQTTRGKFEGATTWHKFYVIQGTRVKKNRLGNPDHHRHWLYGCELVEKEAKDLKPGDRLYTPADHEKLWSNGIDPVLSYIAGYAAGDGIILNGYIYGRNRHEIRLYDQDKNQLDGVAHLLQNLQCTCHIRSAKPNMYEMNIYGGQVVDQIVKIQIGDLLKDAEAFIAWLAGFTDAEGYVDKGRCRVRISQANYSLLTTLQSALSALGFNTYLAEAGYSKGSHSWQLAIVDRMLLKHILRYSIKKAPEIRSALAKNSVKRPEWPRVISTETVDTTPDEYLYDLSTDAENYCANGVIVHNTWCASCAAGSPAVDRSSGLQVVGMAKDADLTVIKVLGFVIGMGMDSWILDGLAHADSIGADVISMSLGSNVTTKTPEEDVYYEVFKELNAKGRIAVVASGNSGPDPGTVGSPGDMPDVLTVAAYNPQTDELADFSSRGPTQWGDIKPDVSAPGVNILSALIGVLDEESDKLKNRYGAISGTSMATPHVAGLVCQMIQDARSRGITLNTTTLKDMMARLGHGKNSDDGWGPITWNLWKNYSS